MTERVIIIGGGFAGLSALRKLKGHADKFEIILIDKKKNHEFLPLLPDIIGNNFAPENLRTSLEDECKNTGATFLEEEVVEIQRENSRVITTSTEYSYSYLIIAAGSVTNFYDHHNLKPFAFEFKSVTHSKNLRDQIMSSDNKNIVICGGGYTGIKVSTAICRTIKKAGMNKQIIIANIKDKLCPMFEHKMSDYILQQINESGIKVELANTVVDYKNSTTYLQNGEKFEDSLLIWVSGVKIDSVFSSLCSETMRQGRLSVNKYLQLSDKIFVAGDCAAFKHNHQTLRMSVQNALTQGCCAAKNIIRIASGKKMKEFKPFDPGYVLPVYTAKSCGKIMGLRLYGKLPLLLHYVMCTVKSCTLRNKINVLKECLFKR